MAPLSYMMGQVRIVHATNTATVDLCDPGIAGIQVDLYDNTGTFVTSGTTDQNGMVEYTGVAPGTYNYRFAPPTTLPILVTNNATQSSSGSTIQSVNVSLSVLTEIGLTDGITHTITVNAGSTVTSCSNAELELSSLQASTTGNWTTVQWSSLGTGTFTPSTSFDEAVYYTPSAQDEQQGYVILELSCGSALDHVRVELSNEDALSCSNSVNVSYGDDCSVQLTADMMVQNLEVPTDLYEIIVYDDLGDIMTDGVIGPEYAGKTLTVRTIYLCNFNECWSNVKVEDKKAPAFICEDLYRSCTDFDIEEEPLLPIPPDARVDSVVDGSYYISNWDNCSQVMLSYNDERGEEDCTAPYYEIITRTWTATDSLLNKSICSQSIILQRTMLSDLDLPKHYNDQQLPSLSCDDDWDKLSNGFPSTTVTGTVNISGCGHIEATYKDIPLSQCGGGYKLIREWLLIDWCTSEDMNYQQIINVTDKTGPKLKCSEQPLVISTEPFECFAANFKVPFPDSLTDCSDLSVSLELYRSHRKLNIDFELGTDYLTVDKLSLGEYTLRYIVTDECGNQSQCDRDIEIQDLISPTAVCEDVTTVGLNAQGNAQVLASSFDDESVDNCGILRFEAKKVTNACDEQNEFAEIIYFCCDEIGTIQDVWFRVWDINGNYNDCKIQVLVQDKLPPYIQCLPDLTVSCDTPYDLEDMSAFGTIESDGRIIDNCKTYYREEVLDSTSCHLGSLIRIITAYDDFGNERSCTQKITFFDEDPFRYDDILWPEDFDTSGCKIDSIALDLTGEPEFVTRACGMITASHHDEIFSNAPGACEKIIRTWTVVDWCQYDDKANTGIWSDNQTIVIKNETAPILSCQDTILCASDINCAVDVEINVIATDDCSSEEDLRYSWSADLDSDGIKESNGIGPTFTGDLRIGEYGIEWTVEDGCGNVARCTQLLRVTDCSPPEVYCLSELATALMPSSGSLTMHIDQFDIVGVDQCSSSDPILYSFSMDVTDTLLFLNCSTIDDQGQGDLPLDLWATDALGNQQYCSINLRIQDNQSICNLDNELSFVDGCQDTTICAGTLDLTPFTSILETTTMCDQASLYYSWRLDAGSNGSIDDQGEESTAQLMLPLGSNTLHWEVVDCRGIRYQCSRRIQVEVCQASEVECTTTHLKLDLPSDGVLSFEAEMLYRQTNNLESSLSHLEFSFSATDLSANIRNITCTDIPNGISDLLEVNIWITDLLGVQSVCPVYMTILDRFDVCTDAVSSAKIGGSISTPKGIRMPETQVELRGSSGLFEDITDDNGLYSFEGLAMHEDYMVIPKYEDQHIQSLTIADLVITQLHILDIDTFRNPLQYLAADVDASNNISITDMVNMRKVILGIDQDFQQVPIWRFLPVYDLPNTAHEAFNSTEHIDLYSLDRSYQNANFLAIRSGDVNFSFALENSREIEIRSPEKTFLTVQKELTPEGLLCHFALEANEKVRGLQFFIKLPKNWVNEAIIQSSQSQLSLHNFNRGHGADDTILSFCWTDVTDPINMSSELFTLLIPGFYDDESSSIRLAEDFLHISYDDVSHPIELKELDTSHEQNLTTVETRVYPNPFTDDLLIDLSQCSAEQLELTIWDAKGSLINRRLVDKTEYSGSYKLPAHVFPTLGLYHIVIDMNGDQSVNRVIRISK